MKTSRKSQNFIESYPGAQFSPQNKNPINASNKLLKNPNWTFPVVRYFTGKLEFVSNNLTMILGGILHFDDITKN